MSEFLGLEGMDLSDVQVKTTQILGVGRHVVKITDAAVEKDDSRNTARLVLSYENTDGSIRQWIYVYHGGSPKATEVGKKQLKELLLTLGHDGKEAPNPGYFKGKTVGINVKNEEYNGKTQAKVSYHFTPKEAAPAAGKPMDDEIPF
jgi:hypothetical protein